MSTYIIYQCSVCRRTKNILQDNVRAIPNQCVITKGCTGSLFNIGQTSEFSVTPAVAGLTDWYPRGEKISPTPETVSPSPISLSCSSTGVLTLALYLTDAQAAANQSVVLDLTQRSNNDVSFVQYVFNVGASTTILSGRDSTSKNLRFDQLAIDQGRVFVIVNGVARFSGTAATEMVLTPNTVTFNSVLPAGAVVSVSVYSQQNTVQRQLTFVQNSSFIVSSTSGSWGNVRWVNEYDPSTGAIKPNKWWLYSCTTIDSIVSLSRLLLTGILEDDGVTPIFTSTQINSSVARFLLSAAPHENIDRYLNLFVDTQILTDGYALSTATSGIIEMFADAEALTEIYPPLQLTLASNLASSSFVTADVFSTSASTTTISSSNSLLSSSKILGPI